MGNCAPVGRRLGFRRVTVSPTNVSHSALSPEHEMATMAAAVTETAQDTTQDTNDTTHSTKEEEEEATHSTKSKEKTSSTNKVDNAVENTLDKQKSARDEIRRIVMQLQHEAREREIQEKQSWEDTVKKQDELLVLKAIVTKRLRLEKRIDQLIAIAGDNRTADFMPTKEKHALPRISELYGAKKPVVMEVPVVPEVVSKNKSKKGPTPSLLKLSRSSYTANGTTPSPMSMDYSSYNSFASANYRCETSESDVSSYLRTENNNTNKYICELSRSEI